MKRSERKRQERERNYVYSDPLSGWVFDDGDVVSLGCSPELSAPPYIEGDTSIGPFIMVCGQTNAMAAAPVRAMLYEMRRRAWKRFQGQLARAVLRYAGKGIEETRRAPR